MNEKLALFGGEKVRKKPFVSQAMIGDEERQRVAEVLDSGMLSGFIANASDAFYGGKQVTEFEASIKKHFNVTHAVTCNSATAGLHMALVACGVGPGDEVIVPPYTMSATATAVIMANAVPVFADIEEENFCIDPEQVKEKITSKTKAIVVVHLFGQSASMNPILELAEKHKLLVVEDCAQAPDATYNGTKVGTLGDVGVFSLNQHKTITSGEGGFCITNKDDLALRMQLVRNHGEVIVEKMGVSDIEGLIGYNYRMTELEAAVAIGQFNQLERFTAHRIRLAEYLTSQLRKFEEFILPGYGENSKHVYFVYPIRLRLEKMKFSRSVFVKALLAEGIPVGAGYVRPIYLEPMYQKKIAYGHNGWPFSVAPKNSLNYVKGICPVCERMHEEELIVTPVCRYPHTEEDMEDVVRAFEKVLSQKELLRTVDV